MILKEITSEIFINFTKHFKIKSIYQTPAYAYVMNKEGFETLFVGLYDDEKIIGASLILIEKLSFFKYAYAPRGFLIDYEDFNLLKIFSQKIKDFLNKKDVIAIKINPYVIRHIYNTNEDKKLSNVKYDLIFNNLKKLDYYHYGYNKYFEGLKPRFESIIELNEPNMFNNLKKEVKSSINSASRNGVKIFKGDESNLNYLYLHTKNKYPRDLKYFKNVYKFYNNFKMVDFYYSKLDTKDFVIHTQNKYNEYLALKEDINNDFLVNQNDKFLTKKMEIDKVFEKYEKQLIKATEYLKNHPDGIVTASVMVIKSDLEVYLLIDGFDENYKEFNSKHLLIWNLIEQFNEKGYKVFNLAGTVDIDSNNPKYNGLKQFKLNFNSKIYEYIGDLELIVNNTKYFMYKNTSHIRSILKK